MPLLPPVGHAVSVGICLAYLTEETCGRYDLRNAVGALPRELKSRVPGVLVVLDAKVVESDGQRQRGRERGHRVVSVVVDDTRAVKIQPRAVVRAERQLVEARLAHHERASEHGCETVGQGRGRAIPGGRRRGKCDAFDDACRDWLKNREVRQRRQSRCELEVGHVQPGRESDGHRLDENIQCGGLRNRPFGVRCDGIEAMRARRRRLDGIRRIAALRDAQQNVAVVERDRADGSVDVRCRCRKDDILSFHVRAFRNPKRDEWREVHWIVGERIGGDGSLGDAGSAPAERQDGLSRLLVE